MGAQNCQGKMKRWELREKREGRPRVKRQDILQRKKTNGQMMQAGDFQPGGGMQVELVETERRDWQRESPLLRCQLVSFDMRLGHSLTYNFNLCG